MLIFRSLVKEILLATFTITLLFMLIIFISRFLYFLNHAAMGLISMHDLMKMMVIIIALFSVHVLLLSFYISMIFVLSRFFCEQEMTALFASGFSRMHLMGYMMLLAFGVSILISGMVLWLEPVATYSQDIVYAEALSSAELSKIIPNKFEILDNGNKVIYVKKSRSHYDHHQLDDVTVIQHTPAKAGQKETWDISTANYAEKAKLPGSNNSFIVMHKGQRYQLTKRQLNVYEMAFKDYGIGIFTHKPNVSLPVEGLATSYLWNHRHDSIRYVSGLQYRFSIILTVFLLTLVAVPLSYVAPRQGRFVKLIPALIIYLVYMGLLLSNKNWIVQAKYHTWIYLCWLQMLLLLIGLLLFRYGMGPLTHRYRNRLKKVLMPWTIRWRSYKEKHHVD